MSGLEKVLQENPWMEAFKDKLQVKCHDCGAELGEPHGDGCDTARCSVCHSQRLVCDCEGSEPDCWTGLMYPELHKYCLDNDLWCRDLSDTGQPIEDISEAMRNGETIHWHIPCKRTDKGAHADLNRAAMQKHA